MNALRRWTGTGLTLATVAALCLLAARTHAQSERQRPATPPAGGVAPMAKPGVQPMPSAAPVAPAMSEDLKAQIRSLDDQIKSLRDDYHAQLDPLESQIKALHDKFDPQLKSLADQRKALVEQGESPDLRTLDEQETSELATLADNEKAELDKVRQHYNDERKQIQQKYQDQRRQLQAGRH